MARTKKENHGAYYAGGQTVDLGGNTAVVPCAPGSVATPMPAPIPVAPASGTVPMPAQAQYVQVSSSVRSIPFYAIDPRDRSAMGLAMRAMASALRHSPIAALSSLIFAGYVVQFLPAAGFNLIRAEKQQVPCSWLACFSPTTLGTNLTSAGIVTETAATAHDGMLRAAGQRSKPSAASIRR